MHLQVTAWLDAVVRINTLHALKENLDFWIRQLGFRYLVYHGRFPGTSGPGDEVRLDTTPAAWRDYCLGSGMDSKWDLLCSGAMRTTPILWCKIESLHPELFEKARQFGLATGVTQPMHGPGGEWSALSFITGRTDLRAERKLLAALPQCQLLASLVHDTVARIVASQPDASMAAQRPAHGESALSERESACLGLAASGKTIPQIAGILPITARTVAFHLVNARRKLQAASLRHAVTKAASLGLIRAA
jgi:DNA-binding CsgD family transcriptional regulator